MGKNKKRKIVVSKHYYLITILDTFFAIYSSSSDLMTTLCEPLDNLDSLK